MRAVVIEEPHTTRVVDIERPNPGAGEVLVRVGAVGICGSDVELIEGTRPPRYVRYPIIPGHEWAGTVELVGPNVTGVKQGDRIVAEGFQNCGVCARCREGRTNLCVAEYAETGFTEAGAFAEFLLVPARLIHRLPDNASLEAAALLEPAACVASGLWESDVRPGQSVVVVGSGTLGILAVALLRLSSPRRLALIGTRPERLALGRRFGATETWNPAETVGLATQFDLVVEATNRDSGAVAALQLARRGGTIILEGISGATEAALHPDQIVLGQLRVQGIFGASSRAWGWVVELFSGRQLDLTPLITHRFSLEEYESAFATLQDPAAGALKVQLSPNGGTGG